MKEPRHFIFVGFVAGFIIGGFLAGYTVTAAHRKMCIDAGVGFWTVDSKTGETFFRYGVSKW